jgi:hypothetical protein
LETYDLFVAHGGVFKELYNALRVAPEPLALAPPHAAQHHKPFALFVRARVKGEDREIAK